MKGWWRQGSLRFRLALWYGMGGALLLAVFGAIIYFYVALSMGRPLDFYLRQDLAEVQERLDLDLDGTLRWDGRVISPEMEEKWLWDDPWFELWDQDGRLVRRLWPLEPNQVRHYPYRPAPGRETLSIFNVAANLPLRVLSVPYHPAGRNEVWTLRVMSLHQSTGDPIGPLAWIIALALPMVVGLLVTGGYLVTRHWLGPLDRMVTQAEGITANELSRRLAVANPHDELGRLATVFNHTLDRLENSFVALDRFAADASHELRTPLTTMRTVGEVGLRRDRTVDEYREIIGSMLEEAQRLDRLVERLLQLASAESGARTMPGESFRLDHFVTTSVNEIGILAEARDQRLVIEAQACVVSTDPVLLRQALQNLVDNAMKYSPAGATIRISVRSRPDGCLVTVADEGPGISPEQQAWLGDRFRRLDGSQTHGRGGFGLGLAITKAYLQALGGSLEYEAAQPHGSRFSLVLPRAG